MIGRTHCIDCEAKLEDWNSVWKSPIKRDSRCRACRNEHLKEYHRRTGTSERSRKYRLKNRYDVTPEEYKRLYDAQWGGCAICRVHFDLLFVDHNHETGEVRGLLCNKCNTVTGYIEKNEDILTDVVEYLKRTASKVEAA